MACNTLAHFDFPYSCHPAPFDRQGTNVKTTIFPLVVECPLRCLQRRHHYPFMHDLIERRLEDLRISVTDRCNFRCSYCMPRRIFHSQYRFTPIHNLLSYEEIARMVGIFHGLGVRKVRLTGGEPLVRKKLEILVEKIMEIDQDIDCCLTTNGSLLTHEKAQALKNAGLKRTTISLDSLVAQDFLDISDAKCSLNHVLQGIENAQKSGFSPVKINMVVKRGMNEEQILDMAEFFRHTGCILRFIEFMDVGNHNQWDRKYVVPTTKIIETIQKVHPIEPLSPNYAGEVSNRWKYKDGGGEIGFISSVTQPFCRECTRIRMSAKGEIFTCLFSDHPHPFKNLLRSTADDRTIRRHIQDIWKDRKDRYSEVRERHSKQILKKVEMSYIGG